MPVFMNTPLYMVVGGLHIIDMLVVLFSFMILLVLVRKFAWGPVMDMMKKREDYIAGELESAEESRKIAAKHAEEAEQRLLEMKQEAQKMMEDARVLAAKQEEDILNAARTEATRLKEAARKDIVQEKENAIQALQDQVASLSVMIASKVIEKELSEQDQSKLIDEYVKQLGEES